MNWLSFLIFLGFGFSWAVATPTEATTKESEKFKSAAFAWPEKCNEGPSYWCLNRTTGEECGATEHCKQTVWRHLEESPAVKSEKCQKCLLYIDEVRQMLLNNATKKQVEIVLGAVCQLIPYYLVTKECVFLVDKYIPDLLDNADGINPDKICETIFVCDEAPEKEHFEFKSPDLPLHEAAVTIKTTEVAAAKKVPEIDCRGCYTLTTTAQKLFKRSSRDDVLKGILEICGKLSSFSDACNAYVLEYFPVIYQRLTDLSTGDVCHLSGVCSEKYHIHEITTELQTAIDNAPEEANDEVCDFCVAMVHHLKDIVVANTTVDEFEKVLQGICKQTGNFKDQCLQLVDQYYTLIYQFLISELNGEELCKEINLCTPKTLEGHSIESLAPIMPLTLDLDALVKKEKESDSTEVDLHRVDLTRDQPKHKPILVGAKKCTWGPAYWCTNMTTSKECSGSLAHCIKKWETMELPVDNGDICNICKDMVKQARDQLNSNETQEELRQVLEGSCLIIPIKIAKKECIKAVDDFVPELVEALSSQMNPQVVCATVGLCNNARMDLLLQQEKMSKSEAVESVAQLPIDRMFPAFLEKDQKEEVMKRGKEACEMCELFLHFVQNEITLPKSEDQIKALVNNVCVKLPKSVASQCTEFIAEYGAAFISILAQEIDPSTVCPSIGACPAMFALIDDVKPTCPMCLLAVESIENKLKDNKTEKSVIAAVNHLCSELSSNLSKECQLFVNKTYSELVDSILADFSPQETCTYLKMCSDSIGMAEMIPTSTEEPKVSNEIAAHATDVEKDQNKCVICEFIMSKLEQELKEKKTAEEIKRSIHGVCNHLPLSVKKECNTFVTQYTDLIIDLLASSIEPREICTQLHVCQPAPGAVAAVAQSKITKCVVCEAMIGVLQGVSSDTSIEKKFYSRLYAACMSLSEKYHDACLNIVDQLAPQIERIAQIVPASFICSHVGVCPKYRHRFELLTSENCVEGPAFWCTSTTNAAACGVAAIEHCQQHVWKSDKPMRLMISP